MKRVIFWVLVWLAWARPWAVTLAQGELRLTEFLAANARNLRDENGDYPDWIEVHNAGAAPLNLEGWTLTDSTNQPGRWMFPSTNLAANAYLVVYASGKDRAVPGQPLHTSFSLNADGEYLALISPEGEIATEFAPRFPPQLVDVSYGLRNGRQYYFSPPTPNLPNQGGYNDFVADTKFSVDRGFYEQSFQLAITTATAGATIVYTTNGTPPTLTFGVATNGSVYAGPLMVGGTTVLRAAAYKEGFQPSNVDTQTYIFLDDVLQQSPTGQPPPGWPSSWGANTRDYGMDPDIVNHPQYRDTIRGDLKSLPTFSIVMDLNDLFSSARGIYANAGQQGRAWERPCSVELVYPDGTLGFQIDCGIRIRGGFSRSSNNPKHAFRLFFREQYGAPKLRYPLFGDAGTDTFDAIDLRTFQNYSWSFQGDSRGIFIRDQFNRDTQLEMGHQAERGEFYHLYLNGQYWGLFNTCERPEASYAETYYGGQKEDYDVIKVEAGPYTIFATDGNLQAWAQLYNLARSGLASDADYERVQGNHPDGTRKPSYPNLVEVDNLIDYMLITLYGGNLDAPISNFLGNNSPNNWYGIRSRTDEFGGFRFFIHDAEHTLLNLNESRIGPYAAGDTSVTKSNPQWVWQKMWANPEFQVRSADRVHRHFFNGGALTPEAALARFRKRQAEIDRAVVGESARWGDAKRGTPFTREDWLREINNVANNYLPRRSDIVLSQLRSRGLYPNVTAPSFNQHGGAVPRGFLLSMTRPTGTVYYTRDGSDPRLRGGAVAPGARTYQAPMALDETTLVKARALVGGTWSALNEATFTLIQTYTNLLLTELMYHPAPEGEVDGDQFEFIELKNVNPFEIDLSGVRFTNGVRFAFPLGTKLGPGRFAVLARNATNFARRYPGVFLDGVYSGSLANGGERVTLVHAVGTPLFSVEYRDAAPWPETADGQGFSLVPIHPNMNEAPDDPAQWRASSRMGGSPGADDPPAAVVPVVINELLTHTDPPAVDAVELHNPTALPADIGGWFLTDDRATPQKYRLPSDTVLAPGAYRVFDEGDFNPVPGLPPSFSFSSHGEEVYLYSADAAGNLTGYSDGFGFGAAANSISFGRYTNSVGEVQYPAQRASSLGTANAGPRVGPVVINEIRYHPAPGDEEFLELKNITDQPVRLYDPLRPTNTWRLNGVGFTFPPGIELPAQGLGLLVGTDPGAFRSRYRVAAQVPVLGPYPGVLQDNGELLELQQPDAPDLTTNALGEVSVLVPWVTVDAVRYNDRAPWPVAAAGTGPSLERVDPQAYGNDPANWRASFGPASPGLDNDGNRMPVVDAGLDIDLQAAVFPARTPLSGSATDDGLPKGLGGLRPRWLQIGGPAPALVEAPEAFSTQVQLPGTGRYVFRLVASDGELTGADEVTLTVTRPSTEQTLVPAGAVWRYLDDGSDQGTAWRALGFNDGGWRSGQAQLGYGDGDEATVVGYGPASNTKYITTYFRRSLTVAGAASVTALTLKILRDDGPVVYLNGTEVMRDNLPEGEIGFQTRAGTAIGGADESAFLERAVDPGLLREGLNVLAVEMHQVSPTSSDLSFDLQLDALAFPADRPPTVDAGPDLAIALPNAAVLDGRFTDDGLPGPPGVVTLEWVKVSGPGQVSFSEATLWRTTATFSAAGDYVLRLTATDGAAVVSDSVLVRVSGVVSPPQIVEASVVFGASPSFQLGFDALAGRSYRVQFRDTLGAGPWQELTTIPPGAARRVLVTDPLRSERRTRYYRMVLE